MSTYQFQGIDVGDIARRITFGYHEDFFVLVLEKELLDIGYYKYTVIKPDGDIATYTDALLRMSDHATT